MITQKLGGLQRGTLPQSLLVTVISHWISSKYLENISTNQLFPERECKSSIRKISDFFFLLRLYTYIFILFNGVSTLASTTISDSIELIVQTL